MSVEEVVGRLKIHEERLRGYEDKEEEKYLLLTRTRKKDADDSSFSGTRRRESPNKENGGRGCGRRHGGKEGHDNTSQIHVNVNP